MAKKPVLKCFYLFCSAPFFTIAVFCYITNIANVRTYYQLCVKAAKLNRRLFNDELLTCLQLAEDKRNTFHFGVDYVGVIRALIASLRGSLQGASTIEQQFVRTVIKRYERTINRKFVEQLVSLLICIRLGKRCIAESYLNIAFFGTSMIGYEVLVSKLRPENIDIMFYCGAVARLKYPQPRSISNQWHEKFTQRTKVIYSHYAFANKAIKSDIKQLGIVRASQL